MNIIPQAYFKREFAYLRVRGGSLAQAAELYASIGIRVFPCVPGSKEPLVAGGFHSATTDPEQIRRWWERWPDANIGCPDFTAMDLDDEWKDSITQVQIPPTAMQWSGSRGERMHYIYLPNGEGERLSSGRVTEGIDIKVAGRGYILLAPSVTDHEYFPYMWSQIREIPTDFVTKLASMQIEYRNQAGEKSHYDGEVPARTRIPESIQKGDRNHALFTIGCSWRAYGWGHEAIVSGLSKVNRDRCSPPIEAGEISKIAASVCKYDAGNAPSEEVLEYVDRFFEAVIEGSLRGFAYSLAVVLTQRGYKYGDIIPGGVRVEESMRNIKDAIGTKSTDTLYKAIRTLKTEGYLTQDRDRKRNESGAFVLRIPTDSKAEHPNHLFLREGGGGVPVMSRLRWTKPVFSEGQRIDTVQRLGKQAERVLDRLVLEGRDFEVKELARLIGSRGNNLRRRALRRLYEAEIIRWYSHEGREYIGLAEDWQTQLDFERVRAEELADDEYQRERHRKESKDFRARLMYYSEGIHPEQIEKELDMKLSEVEVALQRSPTFSKRTM